MKNSTDLNVDFFKKCKITQGGEVMTAYVTSDSEMGEIGSRKHNLVLLFIVSFHGETREVGI